MTYSFLVGKRLRKLRFNWRNIRNKLSYRWIYQLRERENFIFKKSCDKRESKLVIDKKNFFSFKIKNKTLRE